MYYMTGDGEFNLLFFILHFYLHRNFNFIFTDLPKFGERLQNITVPVGRDAVLICVVDNLQTYKVNFHCFPIVCNKSAKKIKETYKRNQGTLQCYLIGSTI